jgi:hypothetical protein
MKLKQDIEMWIKGSLSDPVAILLARNSHLTRTQLETLLIDIFADNFSGKRLNYDEKAQLRLTKAKISRGSFNRTLRQAKENLIKSIYTVLLLGYLGIFEDTTLDPYLEIANKLHAYLEAHKNMPDEGEDFNKRAKLMKTIREELELSLSQLSNPSKGSP